MRQWNCYLNCKWGSWKCIKHMKYFHDCALQSCMGDFDWSSSVFLHVWQRKRLALTEFAFAGMIPSPVCRAEFTLSSQDISVFVGGESQHCNFFISFLNIYSLLFQEKVQCAVICLFWLTEWCIGQISNCQHGVVGHKLTLAVTFCRGVV